MVNRCSLCKENEESADHILIHCGKTRELWPLLLSSFGVVWVFLTLVRNLLLEWKIKGLGKKRRAVWRLAPICLLWCIWGERNQITFQEEEMSDTCLRNLFFRSLLEWSQQFLDLDYLSFLNFFGDWLVGQLFPLQVFSFFCCFVFGFLCILFVYIGSAPYFGVFYFIFLFVYQIKKTTLQSALPVLRYR